MLNPCGVYEYAPSTVRSWPLAHVVKGLARRAPVGGDVSDGECDGSGSDDDGCVSTVGYSVSFGLGSAIACTRRDASECASA